MGYTLIKSGIRKCNINYYYAGKDLVAPLFFFSNHPLYRKLFLFNNFDVALMPEFIWYEYKKTIGVKIKGKGASNEEDIGENLDFCVENVNKQLKNTLMWAPTKSAWLIACRTFNFGVALANSLLEWVKR